MHVYRCKKCNALHGWIKNHPAIAEIKAHHRLRNPDEDLWRCPKCNAQHRTGDASTWIRASMGRGCYILVKVYPNSGCPQQFAVVFRDDDEEYRRLTESYGYTLHDSTCDTPSVDKCWRMYTQKDSGGYDYLISGQNV